MSESSSENNPTLMILIEANEREADLEEEKAEQMEKFKGRRKRCKITEKKKKTQERRGY